MVDIKLLNNFGLTETQLKNLDALDGTVDNQVSQSVFDILKAHSEDNFQMIQQLSKDNDVKNLYEKIKTIIGDIADNFTKPAEVDQMQKLADSAAQYIVQNGDDGNFNFVGFPIGIEAIHMSHNLDYGDASNDVFSIDANGDYAVERHPDKLSLKVTFILNGKEYSVSSEAVISNQNGINASKLEQITDFYKNDTTIKDVNNTL